MSLFAKEQEVHNFEIYLEISLIILMWWQYFLFSECMLEQCIFFIVKFMNVKFVGSWKNDEKKRNVIDDLKNHKIDSWSKKKQWKACRKKSICEKKERKRKKKKKQAEKANKSLNQKARVK